MPRFSLAWLALFIFASAVSSQAYFVSPAVPLDELARRSDLIFKGTVLSEFPSDLGGFQPIRGFRPFETRFRVISVLKGGNKAETISFQHYDEDAENRGAATNPQSYHLTPGQTYLVFASRLSSDPVGTYRQIWMSHTGIDDQGVLLCADDKPLGPESLQGIFWDELTALLNSRDPFSVVYAIQHLDQFSGSEPRAFGSLQEFPRDKVIAAIKDITGNSNPEIAQAALRLIGSQNPYMSEERTPFWLGTVGSADTPGLGKMDRGLKNLSAARNAPNLISLVDSDRPDSSRALAILSLGLTRDPSVEAPILRWLTDPSPEVRAAATTLLADFPSLATGARFEGLAADSSSLVRAAVARSIGFGQYIDLVDILTRLVSDRAQEVRRIAVLSLLSFSPQKAGVARIFESQLSNTEFAPLFLLALARENPTPYRDGLAEVITKEISPSNWGGGEIPGCTAWRILFQDLKAQSAADLQTGGFDRYLDAFEHGNNYGTSPPTVIYAFYLSKGLVARAKKYRAEAVSKATYNLSEQLDRVDANPSSYLGG